MTFGIIGENCSGKSTLAEAMAKRLGAECFTGKDYLRMAKSEAEASCRFREKLKSAMEGGNVIYVVTEPAQLALLPEGAIRILVKADLETIKARFRARMHGTLPPPVEKMLEQKHGIFDSGSYACVFDGASGDPDAFCDLLLADHPELCP